MAGVKEGVLQKYGPIKGLDLAAGIPVPMGASEVLAIKSGRFVKGDGSGRMEIAGAGSTLIAGHVEASDPGVYASGVITCSSTEGGTTALWFPSAACLGEVFRIPINSGTYAATMVNKTCDISVSSNIQGAALNLSSEDTFIIVGGDATNNLWVDVILNPAKLTGYTGVV